MVDWVLNGSVGKVEVDQQECREVHQHAQQDDEILTIPVGIAAQDTKQTSTYGKRGREIRKGLLNDHLHIYYAPYTLVVYRTHQCTPVVYRTHQCTPVVYRIHKCTPVVYIVAPVYTCSIQDTQVYTCSPQDTPVYLRVQGNVCPENI